MLFHSGQLRFLAVATTMLASMSFISAASAAGPTYALVQINQQALFFNLMTKGAQDAAKASGKDAEIAKMKTECEEMTKKLNWIRKTKAEADAEIKKLTNQVNLLKKELNK